MKKSSVKKSEKPKTAVNEVRADPRSVGVGKDEVLLNCLFPEVLPQWVGEKIVLTCREMGMFAIGSLDKEVSPYLDPVPLLARKSRDITEYRRYGFADPRYVIPITERALKDGALINFLVDAGKSYSLKSNSSWYKQTPVVRLSGASRSSSENAHWYFIELKSCSTIDTSANSVNTFATRMHMERLLSRKFIYGAHLDVKSFYDSVYTHSFDWLNKSKNDPNRSLFSMCDHWSQSINAGKTAGLVTGPLISKIIAEVLMSGISRHLVDAITNELKKVNSEIVIEDSLQIIRYVDDFRIYYSDESVYRAVKKSFVKTLSTYHLTLNNAKTKSELPVSIARPATKGAYFPDIEGINSKSEEVWSDIKKLRSEVEDIEIAEFNQPSDFDSQPNPYIVSRSVGNIETIFEALVKSKDREQKRREFRSFWKRKDQLLVRFFRYCESTVINYFVRSDHSRVPRVAEAIRMACVIESHVDRAWPNRMWNELLAIYRNTSSEVTMISAFDVLYRLNVDYKVGSLDDLKAAAITKVRGEISSAGVHAAQLISCNCITPKHVREDSLRIHMENDGKRMSHEWIMWIHLPERTFNSWLKKGADLADARRRGNNASDFSKVEAHLKSLRNQWLRLPPFWATYKNKEWRETGWETEWSN